MQCYNHPEQGAVAACASCGKGACETCAVEVGGRIYCKQCLATGVVPVPTGSNAPSTPGAQQQYGAGTRWLLYIVSFLIPIGGLIAGIVLMTRGDTESKQVGTNCIVVAIAGFAFNCVCVLCSWLFSGILIAAVEANSALLLLLA
ncbi:MAG: hypothetical protein KKB13_14280 [Chloroflexi bacterium]|nr:hypothetical protein [Chloroflexota bacterium]